MKRTKKISAFIGACVLVTAFFVGVKLQSMKPPSEEFKFTLKSRRRGQLTQPSFGRSGVYPEPVEGKGKPRYKSEIVWIKTSDNMLMEVPRWQIDQMKVLQVVLVHQKGGNSRDNPIDASMVTSEQLQLLEEVLQKAGNLKEFKLFCDALALDKKTNLVNSAFTLEAQGLASLLIAHIFPKELQQQMGASVLQQAGIIAPVVDYLQSVETLPLSHKGLVYHGQFSPDGRRIIVTVSSGNDPVKKLILYDVITGKESVITGKGSFLKAFSTRDVVFSSDGRYIAANIFAKVFLLKGDTGQVLGQIKHTGTTCVAFSHDNNNIILGSDSKSDFGSLVMYNIKTERRNEEFEYNNALIYSLVCSSDGKYIVAGTAGNEVERVILFDATTGRWMKAFKGLARGRVRVAINSDNNLIVAGSLGGNELVLWEVESGEQRASLKGHDGGIQSVTFSPDGKYIVSGSWGVKNNFIIWDVETEKMIQNIQGFKDALLCVAFSPDGNYLLCGDVEGAKLLKFILPQTLNDIATKLNIAQARFLYRLYLAKINNVPVILDQQDLDYQIFLTLPDDVQRVVKAFLPFELASDIFEKEIQQKMKELRESLFYVPGRLYGRTEKTHEEKIKAVKDAMLTFDKSSAAYNACERLLVELEQEEAFKVIEEKK